MLQLHKSSGSARTAYENIRYFKSRGFEVHVATMTMDKELLESMGAIPHKMLPFIKSTGLTRRKWYNWQVQRLRKKLSPAMTLGHGDILDQDVLTLHNCVFLASELIEGKPLSPDHEMAMTHGGILNNHGFKKMIANSELMKRDTIARFRIDEKKIQVIYPALDTKTFYPKSLSEKTKLKERFQFPDKVIVSLVTSGNFKKRGLDLFIQAIEALPPEIQDKASFRVLGKDESGKYQRPFLTFDPALSDIENYFNAIDVFVLPARIEEFGRVVLEAMGCGLPVITTDKVGAGELLTEGSAKFVRPSENIQALTNALSELILKPELRSYLGELNGRKALEHSEERLFPQFDRVFNLET
jgi:UDP-glucose:(heptosyl)LPS alpha-1,3-glucosyltransferase